MRFLSTVRAGGGIQGRRVVDICASQPAEVRPPAEQHAARALHFGSVGAAAHCLTAPSGPCWCLCVPGPYQGDGLSGMAIEPEVQQHG